MGMVRSRVSSARLSSSRPTSELVSLLEKTDGAAFGFHVGDGRGDGNLGFALEDVKSRGTEIAFAADDVALAEAAFHDGAAIEFEESSGDAGEDRQLVEVLRRRVPRQLPAESAVPATLLLVSAPVGQETMHSPQEMQVESPIGAFRSKAMPAA